MRPDCIGALGNPHIRTPALDQLVERGMSFSRAYVLGANSGAVCTPSRTMLLTGRTVFHISNGGFAKGEKGPETLWPKAMSAAGYETFHLGKKGNSYRPGMEAFDTCLYTDDIGAKEHDVSAKVCADRVIDFLDKRKADRPFFIYLAPPVPHDPRIAPKELMDLYTPSSIPLPPRYRPVHPFDNGEMTVRDERWKLIRYPLVDTTQLFDLQADPNEMDDLSAKPEHADRVKAMLERMKQLQRELDDPVPLTVDQPRPPAWTPPADGGDAKSGKRGARKAGKKGAPQE